VVGGGGTLDSSTSGRVVAFQDEQVRVFVELVSSEQ
jgi:hypothetical protein